MKTKLFRPVGAGEYKLIKESDYKCFPERLDWQPIFYPVMNHLYAEEIAKKWNTRDEFSGFCGMVTAFNVDSEYVKKFKVRCVGGEGHDELWVPAEELSTFNSHLDKIEVVSAFFGEEFDIKKNPELARYNTIYK